MSWFSDYIGKAESLLNALDSSAGDLLTNSFADSGSADGSSSASAAAGATSFGSIVAPNVSGLSSAYLSQQSPIPSFATKRSTVTPSVDHHHHQHHHHTTSAASTKHGRTASRNGESPAPPTSLSVVPEASIPHTSSSSKQASPSAFFSKREERSPSPATPTATSHYSLDSSRLSRQLMRGSVDDDDDDVDDDGAAQSAFSSFSQPAFSSFSQPAFSVAPSSSSAAPSTSSSTFPSSSQSKSNPVISSNARSSDEEALLKFLNAPPTSTAIASLDERKPGPTSSTPRASPPITRSHTFRREPLAKPEDESIGETALDASAEEAIGETALDASADEAKPTSKEPPPVYDDDDDDASCSPGLPTSTCSLEGEGVSSVGVTVAAVSSEAMTDTVESSEVRNEAKVAETEEAHPSSVDSFKPSLTQSSSPCSSSLVMMVSSSPQQQRQFREGNVPEDETMDNRDQSSALSEDGRTGRDSTQRVASPDIAMGDEGRQKASSSNGSSVSGSSVGGEDADLSDAFKDSPTSPFEESEPEMLPPPPSCGIDGDEDTKMIGSSGDMVTSSVDVAMEMSEEMTSSGNHRFSSGPQTESEPEMIPTPPSIGDARLMTSSQVSSSISQRFSDCEIISANELAETDDGGEEVSSPPRKPSVEPTMGSGAAAAVASFEGRSSSPPTVTAEDSLALSKLHLENQLLRSEIHALNDEMQGAWQQVQLAKEERVRAIQDSEAAEKRAKVGEDRARDMMDEFARERKRWAAEADERLREMERRLNEASSLNADAQMSLEAKEGQLAVLRVRFEEADAAADQLRRNCQAMEEENRRVVAERETTVATHVTAFDRLKGHADRIEEQLAVKTQEGVRLHEEVFSLENAAAEEKEGLGSLVTSLQSQVAAEKARSLSLQHQANGAQRAVEAAKKELEEYRAKATRTLQSKDRLIASLQEGSASSSSGSALELDDVKNERDLLREELDSLHGELESCRLELADAEAQAAVERDGFESRLSASEKDLREVKERLELTTMDLATSKRELSCAHDQLHREKIQFQEENLKKSEENENLKRQVQAQSSSSASSSDLEARLHALAENLIEKQTTIETLSTEKTSLKMQLEKFAASGAIKLDMSGARRSPTSVSISVDEDRAGFSNGAEGNNARMRLPLFLRETPEDTGVTRGVKRAATSLDALGIKIGVFFRRYPVARVFALVYAFVLHLWVFVVLLTYSPEMH